MTQRVIGVSRTRPAVRIHDNVMMRINVELCQESDSCLRRLESPIFKKMSPLDVNGIRNMTAPFAARQAVVASPLSIAAHIDDAEISGTDAMRDLACAGE